STLMRCLVALDRPFSGSIEVEGINALLQPREVHKRVGFLSDTTGLYDDLSVRRCLKYAAASHGLRGADLEGRVAWVASEVGLLHLMERRAGTLSRGERQRVGLAQALVHEPQLLVLDEPASGLDPAARHDLSELLKRLRNMGKTIVVSSHILSELEDYSNWMLTLEGGRVRGMVPVNQAFAPGTRWLRVRVGNDVAAAAEAARAVEGVRSANVEGQVLVLDWTRDERAQAQLVAHLVGQGVEVMALEAAVSRMQDVYLAQVGPHFEGGGRESGAFA
ncbi:MAG: putative bacitracin transport ATP-binding protein BcrA, partial [Cyanobacteria bacterium RYN_339]|nr:putative bacitracin transport ATP-binding protein BcrA [Cyanobacteria bacterium RYN_339]